MKDIKIIQYNNKKKINLYNLLNSKYTAVIVHGMFDEKEILKARLELINFFNASLRPESFSLTRSICVISPTTTI